MYVKLDNAHTRLMCVKGNACRFLKLFTCSIDSKDNKQERRTHHNSIGRIGKIGKNKQKTTHK